MTGAATDGLSELLRAMARGEGAVVLTRIAGMPTVIRAGLARKDEFFDPASSLQAYAGHTLLHAAAFAYDTAASRALVAAGADVRARNRRGAEPLHAAAMGSPGSPRWNPDAQCTVIEYLISVGANPDAAATGGVTPLHRAVRNRCSRAVEALLRLGADPRVKNHRGSTALDLARWTTGRGGSGTPTARAEQEMIVALLERATA